MGSVCLYSLSATGLDVQEIRVEVYVSSGLPGFHIVGLADTAVQESKDRIRSALHHAGYDLPRGKITVNLAPAHLHKTGSSFDLPIALGVLATQNAALHETLSKRHLFFSGELGLDASIRPSPHTFLFADWSEYHEKSLVVSSLAGNYVTKAHARLVFAADNLKNLVHDLCTGSLSRIHALADQVHPPSFEHAFSTIQGHRHAKRGLEIAAAGGQHVLLWGPPGSGKTALGRAFEGILTHPNTQELRDIRRIHSLGTFSSPTITWRPFRSPHHTGSLVSLVGGGAVLRPGEISLAHCGVLFLDELAEFPRGHIDALRQPLESGHMSLTRSRYHCMLPAQFQLIATTNPCPCGYYGDPELPCTCYESQRKKYLSRISGPILDRIDMHLHIRRTRLLSGTSLAATEDADTRMRTSVLNAKTFRQNLNQPLAQLSLTTATNYGIPALLSDEAIRIAESMNISARGLIKILRLARTIADLEQSVHVKKPHLEEAWSFKSPFPN